MTTTTTKSLFEISDELLELEAFIEELEGDISDPAVEERVTKWFASLEGEQAKKIDAYINLMRKWEGQMAAAKAEVDRYRKAAQVRENRIETLKSRLKKHMEDTHQQKIETASGRVVAIQKNGGKVPLVVEEVDPTTVPPAYQKISVEIDNEAVRKDLESGVQVAFAKLGERGTQLRIR